MEKLLRWFRFNWMYLRQPPWDTGITPPELAAFIREHPPGRAIDLGCGTGTNLLALARAGWQVTGVDFAFRAVAAARRRLNQAGVMGEVRAGDVSQFDIVRGTYELVLDIGCYHGLPQQARTAYCRNLGAILAPGGHFLIYAHWKSDPNDKWGIDNDDLHGFTSLLTLENRQDSQDRWGRSAVWMRFAR